MSATNPKSQIESNSEDKQKCRFQSAYINNSVSSLLANPIQSGFLLQFSQSEYNAENIIYILEIDKFKDLCDSKAWDNNVSFKVVDSNIDNFYNTVLKENDLVFGGGKLWPCNKITFASFKQYAQKIWDTYLAKSATNQICMSSRVLSNTIHRLKYLDLYGTRVFDETLIDPMKTLDTDVRPRFLTSPHYSVMTIRLEAMYPLPKKETLHIKLPTKSSCLYWIKDKVNKENLRNMPMLELFQDKVIYEQFVNYSKKNYSEGNVYLARAISIFKNIYAVADLTVSTVGNKLPPEADEQAWFIFRYFIAQGAPFEFSFLTARRRKDIMLKLAHPEPNMFLDLEKSVFRLVRDQYVNYSFTPDFEILMAEIIKTKSEMQIETKEFSKDGI